MTPSHIPICFVFNGDADGLISQHLQELDGIAPTLRITGLKREIVLLDRLPGLETANIHVFDISLDVNRSVLMNLLEKPGIQVTWFDHHEPGILPVSPRLNFPIFNARGTCTALLVHASLPKSDPRWAAMAAFGDNVPEAAEALLRSRGTGEKEASLLREAGELLNYNAYGEDAEDVLFHPARIAERLAPFRAPMEFIRESGLFEPLQEQFREDVAQAQNISPHHERDAARMYLLPAQPWARRLGATLANRIALENSDRAVAFLHPLRDGSYRVSIRAPRAGRRGAAAASDLAREFPGGGGRALAAGINRLEAGDISAFERRFFDFYY